MGNKNPDNNIFGIINTTEVNIACRWLLEILETNKPVPNVDRRNGKETSINNQKFPLKGTLKRFIATKTTSNISKYPRIKKGVTFAPMISIDFNGVVINCS